MRDEGGGRCDEATRAGNNTTRQRGGVALGSHGARPSPAVAEGVAETAAGRDDVSTGAPDELRPAVALAAGVTTTVPAMLPTPRSPSGVCRFWCCPPCGACAAWMHRRSLTQTHAQTATRRTMIRDMPSAISGRTCATCTLDTDSPITSRH